MTSATTGRLVTHFKGWKKVALPIGASGFVLFCSLDWYDKLRRDWSSGLITVRTAERSVGHNLGQLNGR
jgi:hypothetical protein